MDGALAGVTAGGGAALLTFGAVVVGMAKVSAQGGLTVVIVATTTVAVVGRARAYVRNQSLGQRAQPRTTWNKEQLQTHSAIKTRLPKRGYTVIF